jgi:hypothetical protein
MLETALPRRLYLLYAPNSVIAVAGSQPEPLQAVVVVAPCFSKVTLNSARRRRILRWQILLVLRILKQQQSLLGGGICGGVADSG